MSTTANLTNNDEIVNTSNDSIVIRQDLSDMRGGKTLDVTGFAPTVINAGHMVIRETATGNYKPMPATELSKDGAATLGTVVPGSGYTNGTYENVPLSGGSGAGALATVVVAGAVVSTITITQKGAGYKVGDSLGVPAAYAGGTGSGGSAPVATIADTAAVYGALPAGHTYAGVLKASILTKRPFASILTRGEVNYVAAPFDMTSILAAVKTALPLIIFTSDSL